MSAKVFFIHTISGLTGLFNDLCAELLPGAEVCHVCDEGIIRRILAAGGLTPAAYRRTCEHVVAAEQDGAQVIQLTCSSISPCVDVAKYLVGVPVLKIDEPMARAAVSAHRSVGIIATNPATLKPSTQLVESVARDMGKHVEVRPVVCQGAYPALLSGNRHEHDRVVRECLLDLMKSVEVICLAQVSMARIADQLTPEQRKVPVLSSPRPAVERLAAVVAGLSAM